MAGSFDHCVVNSGMHRDRPIDLRLLDWQRLSGMLETHSGDVGEAVEELYGMIWWLASQVVNAREYFGIDDDDADVVLEARDHYRDGLEISPGVVEVHESLPGWGDES